MTEGVALPRPQGCAGCAAVPPPPMPALERSAERQRRIELSLPSIHCARCIDAVEAGLAALPEVAAARVHLGLKRVAITAADRPGIEDRLIAHLDRLGYPARPLDSAALEAVRIDAEGRDLLARMAVAGFAMMNVMLMSVAVWSGAEGATRDFLHWVSAAVALPAAIFAAKPFFANALRALMARRLDMDVPIATAIALALGVSLWETALGGRHAYFEAALMLTFFLLIGRYLAHRMRASARSAAAELAALEVVRAERITATGRETVPIEAVRLGDHLAVAPGGRVPADGVVTAGRSEIDGSLLTGETLPLSAEPGTAVSAGMMNLSGPLTIRVEALGEDTLIRRVARLVETAETSRARYATLANRASQYYSHIVNVLAITALLGWGFLGGDWRLAINIAAAVLIITCPCALGLAVPSVLTAASGRLFRMGILMKDGTALEKLAQIDTVVLDKTGTLTTGEPVAVDLDRLDPDAIAVAAALAQNSRHPLARAIAAQAAALGIAPAPVDAVTEHPGRGTEGLADGVRVRLGRADWVGGVDTGAQTAAWLAIGDADPLPVHFVDAPRPDAAATVAALRRAGLRVELLSGDAPGPVAALAQSVGIADWHAAATPEDKVAHLQALAAAGRRVLMVGDGLNDTAALAAAHVSIAPSSAIDASRQAADMILLGARLAPIAAAYDLALTARRRVLENFAMSFGYNIVTVPIAYAGFVTPLIAAMAMSGSSLAVALNALRLGRQKTGSAA